MRKVDVYQQLIVDFSVPSLVYWSVYLSGSKLIEIGRIAYLHRLVGLVRFQAGAYCNEKKKKICRFITDFHL